MYAEDVERVILGEIKEKLSTFKSLSKNQGAITNPKVNDLKIREREIDNEIETLMEKLMDANDVLMTYINKRIVELDSMKKEILSELNTLTTNNIISNY